LDFVGIICNTFALVLKQLDYEKTNGAGSCASYAFLRMPADDRKQNTPAIGHLLSDGDDEPHGGKCNRMPFGK
jgi:hypothetical protein